MKQQVLFLLLNVVLAACYGQEAITAPNGNAGFGTGVNYLSKFPALSSSGISYEKDSYSIVRSTLGVSGSSKTIISYKGRYIISQSIGQAGVIGTYINNGFAIRQGFQQPVISTRIVKPSDMVHLKATIFPNPFNQSVNILLEDLVTNEVVVIISDLTGRNIFLQKFPASRIINLSLEYLPGGIFFLKIITDNKQFVSTLIKQ